MAKTKHRYGVASLTRLERMQKHVLESALDAGKPFDVARRIAAATVNRYRAKQSRRGGPRLVRQGGSRRQWYPGKKKVREVWVCLKHGLRFKTKAAMMSHYRSRWHGRSRLARLSRRAA